MNRSSHLLNLILDGFAQSRYKSASRRNGRLEVKLKEHIKMTKVVTPNYTPSQIAVIEAFQGTGADGRLTLADATTIAAMSVMDHPETGARKPRSIVAKINGLGLPYEKKAVVRKDGSKVQSKADLVAEIASMTSRTFEGLDKAPRADLVVLRDVLAA